ncbi:amidohydrolase 3 [Flagelloscypha sp. PMI_526]|nr:amidohydrolase 3 [Flagelloscypha sp. PMI_526]
MTVKDGFISEVGKQDHLNYHRRVHYLPEGATVLPGFSDSHTHLLHYGSSRLIPLEDGKTVEETVALVRDYILSNPEFAHNKSKTVEGWGWNQMAWPTKSFPTAADLDSDPVIRGRPVILESKDGHAFWVSGATLDANAPYPDSYPGGTIVKNSQGQANGVFLDNAQALILRPQWTRKDMQTRFDITVRDALANGLTSVHDMMLWPPWADFFQSLGNSGALPIRIRGARYFDPDNPKYWGNTTAPVHNTNNDRYSARSVKFVGDGAMRSGGAAMKEPYTDNNADSGFMRVSEEMFHEFVPLFLRDGWQLIIHAIGDKANRIVLDTFEEALQGGGYDPAAIRPRLEHAQIMAQEDIQRIGSLGIIASVQPSHVISDMWFAESRIGHARAKGLYAFRSMLDSGARMTLGSDFPVDSPNPFKTFYAAITRTSVDGTSPHGDGGFFPAEKISRLEALRGLTIEPAYASFTDHMLGSLEPGKRADFVVISQDIMQVPVRELLKTKVLATALDGVVVYGSLPHQKS